MKEAESVLTPTVLGKQYLHRLSPLRVMEDPGFSAEIPVPLEAKHQLESSITSVSLHLVLLGE